MGASSFFEYDRGRDANSIFNYLVEEAQEEHGRRGYTGTIAEKAYEGYKIVSRTPMPLSHWQDYDEMKRLYGEADKWGPAFAAPYAEEKVVGSKDYTIKVKAPNKREAIKLGKEEIAAKGRSRANTTVKVRISEAKKTRDAGKPDIKKVKSSYTTKFKLRFLDGSRPFIGNKSYANITEAKKKFAELITLYLNGGNTYKPIGIVKIEGIHDYNVTPSSRLPTWEIKGTRQQVQVGKAIGWVFWGWASS